MSAADVTLHRMRLAAMAAWRRWLRRRVLPAYWPELALLSPEERSAVRVVVVERRRRFAARVVWDCSLPRFTVDGRRLS